MKKIIIKFIPFLILISFGLGAILELSREKAEIERDIVLSLALLESNISSSIVGNLDKMKGLSTFVGMNPEFDVAETDYFIEQLIKSEDNIISNIGIFEDTTAVYLYPYDENAAMDHIDLQELPAYREDALKVKENFDVIITPPTETIQGGLGIIIRLPISLKNNEYWGQIGYMMRFEDVIEALGIDDSELHFKIEQINDSDNEIDYIFNSDFNEKAITDSLTIRLPSCNWILSASNNSVFDLMSNTFWLLLTLGIFFALITLSVIKKLEFSQFISKGLIESSPDFIVITDKNNDLIDCSVYVTEVFKIEKKNIIGINFKLLLNESKDNSLDLSAIDIDSDASEYNVCLIINGKEKYFSLQNRKMTRNRGFVYIAHDIDEITKREIAKDKAIELAEQTARVQSNFLANMSHEIRTPMNGIIGMIELSLLDNLDDKVSDYLVVAKESANSLLVILNDILDYSKLEANKIELTPTKVSTVKLIEDIKMLYEYNTKEKNLGFDVKIAHEVPKVLICDGIRIQQILNNLLSNAFKFTKKGSIQLSLNMVEFVNENVVVQFTVKDTGIGISNDKVGKLFQRFNQLDESITRNYGGTGLGLAISKELVELMGGQINCNSVENVGTTFSFSLEVPFVTEINIVDSKVDLKMDEKSIHISKSILVVDDDSVNRKVMGLLLKKIGHKVTLAKDGLIAIEYCKNNVYDVILMDISMPEIDGFEATKNIRTLAGYKDGKTSIIAITAFAMSSDKEMCLAGGFDDYISKPIDIDEVSKKILAV